ncbi:MAG: hypothetical protein HeimC3_29660 [Candidatus Heimdallarchaeota archaeon LC_3]|nr:MAG: hypothetical protein HeimC3_29660 [Candidatus Heimdallarchaeota archaeon LC_3]
MPSKYSIYFFLVLFILGIFIPHNSMVKDSNSDNNSKAKNILVRPNNVFENVKFLQDSPIIINSDSDFLSHGFSGNGTKNDPYLIEGLNLSGFGPLITIDGISSNFKVKNNFFTATGSDTKAISIVSTQNGQIENNSFRNFDLAVSIFESHKITITDNTIFFDSLENEFGQTGISIFNSNNTLVLRNTLLNYSFIGITVFGDYNFILENFLLENKHAIGVGGSHNFIANNLISNFIFGITVSNHLIMRNNSILNNDLESSNALLVTEWGLLLHENTQDTIIRNNNFVGLPNLYAFDDGTNNSFENNYWEDWNGTGLYQIGGSSNNFDINPQTSLNSESVTLINFNTGQTGENISPDVSNIPQILALALLSVVVFGLGFLYVRRKKEPSFSKFIQLGEREFLRNIYNKIIVGLETAKTNVISFETPNFQLEGFEVESIINYFPEDIRKELISNIKGRSILVLIEIAYNDPQRTNPAYLSKVLSIPASTLTTEIKKLTKLNYIEPYISKRVLNDPRYKNYTVSEKGYRFLYLMKETLKITLEQMDSSQKFENYTETELDNH